MLNSRGDITISTILKLVLGVLVVAIVVYIIFRYVLKSPIPEQECRTRLAAWCVSCRINEYQAAIDMGQDLKDCATEYSLIGAPFNTCQGHETDCKGYLPPED